MSTNKPRLKDILMVGTIVVKMEDKTASMINIINELFLEMHSRTSPIGNMIILTIWNCPYCVTNPTATESVSVVAKQDHL
jgi:hypothetical protein